MAKEAKFTKTVQYVVASSTTIVLLTSLIGSVIFNPGIPLESSSPEPSLLTEPPTE